MWILTLSLIVAPPFGWKRLREASARQLALPSPLLHAAGLAAMAVAASFLGALLEGEATVGSVTVDLLRAVTSYVGAAVAAAWFAPRAATALMDSAPALVALERHAASAALPLLASGLLRPVLDLQGRWIVTFTACALTSASSFWGAQRFLELSGRPRLTTAAIAAAFASAPPLAVSWLCLG